MEEMRRIAFETVMRACGFASLAIFCIMVGLSFNIRASFQAGGMLTTVMALVLITHDPGIAATFPREVHMRDGEIVADQRR